MKIKIVQPNSKTFNGIKTYSTNLFKDLLKNGIAAELKRLPKVEFSIRGKKIGGWTSQRLLSFLVGNADIVHSTSYMELTPHTNVVTIHDLFSIINNKYKSQMIRDFHIKTLKTIERRRINVVVQGEHIAEQVREYIPDVPIDIIPTKVFVKPATQNPYPDNGKLHLVTMGEIYGNGENRKQIYELYDWIKNLKDVELYHIGIITDEKYKNYSYNIHQLGTVSEQEKFNYLQYANKFVFKTLCEGQGIPTMEAMRLGTQPVINDIPAHRYFLGDKPYYYHNKDEFLEMIYRPKKQGLVEQISQYDNWVEKYKKVYDNVINNHNKR